MLTTIADLARGQAALEPLLYKAAGLSTLFDHYLARDVGDAHERLPGIHASELGCPRRVFYTLTAAEKNPRVPKKWKQRFEHGKALHKMLQAQFHEMARMSGGLLEFQDEVRVRSDLQPVAAELRLDSSTDGIFTFRETVGGPAVLRVLLEIKSESPDGYADIKAPKPEHIEQVHLYMRALDVPLCWFIYFNKGNENNTDSYAPWLIAFDPTIWQKVEAKCRRILHLADTKSEPPKGVESIWCEFCPYRSKSVCNPNYLAQRVARAAAAPSQLRV